MSLLSPDIRQPRTIDDVVALFHEAERELKKIERVNDELPIPPVNELRYAGNHLARAWAAHNRDEAVVCNEEIDKAARHCQRSIYDAHEVGIQFYLKRIQMFQEEYRNVPVVTILKNYPDLRVEANEANEHIQIVAERHRGERDGYYNECREHYNKIKRVAEVLDAARDDLNVQISQDIRATRRWRIGVGVAVFGTLVVALFKLIP